MEAVLDAFTSTKEDTEFRFCGKEIKQVKDKSIRVTVKDNTEKISAIDYKSNRSLNSPCSSEEITKLRSAVASLAWIARQVRADLSYRVSRLQSVVGKEK